MSALDKLINLLEEVKLTTPDLRGKASKALDVLVGAPDEDINLDEIEELDDLNLEEIEPEPEPFDDSYVEFDWVTFDSLRDKQQGINDKITSLGMMEIKYRDRKHALMKEIEEKQVALNKETKDLMKELGCDEQASYTMVIPENVNDLPAFKKQ